MLSILTECRHSKNKYICIVHTMPHVYLIHFDKPIGNPDNPRAQAQHYLGWANDVLERLDQHKQGSSARIMRYVYQNNIGLSIVRLWEGSAYIESRLKLLHDNKSLCPVCNPLKWESVGCYQEEDTKRYFMARKVKKEKYQERITATGL